MLVKVSYGKKQDWFGYEYNQRLNITDNLFNKILNLLEEAKEKNSNILDPLKMMKDKLFVINSDMLKVIQEELEAHSTRRINLEKNTAIFVRGQY